jgi:hypothetical protein
MYAPTIARTRRSSNSIPSKKKIWLATPVRVAINSPPKGPMDEKAGTNAGRSARRAVTRMPMIHRTPQPGLTAASYAATGVRP